MPPMTPLPESAEPSFRGMELASEILRLAK
jgi:hypothetical protein